MIRSTRLAVFCRRCRTAARGCRTRRRRGWAITFPFELVRERARDRGPAPSTTLGKSARRVLAAQRQSRSPTRASARPARLHRRRPGLARDRPRGRRREREPGPDDTLALGLRGRSFAAAPAAAAGDQREQWRDEDERHQSFSSSWPRGTLASDDRPKGRGPCPRQRTGWPDVAGTRETLRGSRAARRGAPRPREAGLRGRPRHLRRAHRPSRRRRRRHAASPSDQEIQDNLRTAIAELRQAANRAPGPASKQPRRRGTSCSSSGVVVGLLYNPVTGPETPPLAEGQAVRRRRVRLRRAAASSGNGSGS